MTPLFPEYTTARALLTFLNGKKKEDYLHMFNTIWDLRGTPQETVDWKDPDRWIPERLSGKAESFAMSMWRETEGKVNPRHVRGCDFLFKNHQLLDGTSAVLQVTARGKEFLSGDENSLVHDIDEHEGIFKIMRVVSASDRAKSADILPEWRDYLLAKTNYKKEGAMYSILRFRLANLLERNYISRQAHRYSLTKRGESYLSTSATQPASALKSQLKNRAQIATVLMKMGEYQKAQSMRLKEKLMKMDPFDFEHLIGNLLENMGYENVEVTQRSNDKGVDVIGTIQNGISEVREIVQVKRFQSNISNGVVNELRGTIPLHGAYRGTIITTSDFTKAAIETALNPLGIPITLINGDKLIELLVENAIGVIPRKLEFFDVDEEFFDDYVSPF